MEFDLITLLSEMCHFAQVHVSDPDAWSQTIERRHEYFQCTTFQVSCFLSQNTVLGRDGVDCNIVLYELGELGVKSVKQWEEIITELVGELGGWK